VLEEATGALWNISSADDLKEAVLTQTAETVVQHAVLPFSGLPMSSQSAGPTASTSAAVQGNHVGGGRNPAANVFRNGTGILRNISAVNDQASASQMFWKSMAKNLSLISLISPGIPPPFPPPHLHAILHSGPPFSALGTRPGGRFAPFP
jgi:hypothetical protein